MNVVTLRRPAPAPRRLGCSACGATAEAACDCGVPYIPAGQRAAEAIAANPKRSDRSIAAEIGVDHKTVGAARKAVGEHSPPERIGRDGKSYPAKTKPVPDRDAKIGQENLRSVLLMNSAASIKCAAAYHGPVDGATIAAARKAATKWDALADQMVESVKNSDDDSDVVNPVALEDNFLHAIGGMNENVRIFSKFAKACVLDPEAATRMAAAARDSAARLTAMADQIERRR